MSIATVLKDPDAVLDYTFDWAGDPDGSWLADGETITDHDIIAPAFTVDSTSADTTTVTVWLSGGTAGYQTVTCRIVTSHDRTDDRTITLIVGDR